MMYNTLNLATIQVTLSPKAFHKIEDADYDRGLEALNDHDIDQRIREALKDLMDDARMDCFTLSITGTDT